jgi:cell division initiation protein
MSLSPLDIAKHEFSRVMRGYDPAEVRAFLERVAEELSDLEKESAAHSEQFHSAEKQLRGFRDLEQSMRDALVTSQDNLKSSRAESERERQNILREAHLQAEEIKLGAEKAVRALHDELRELKVHRDAYVKRLRFLLKSQADLIELLEQESPDK